MMLSILLGRLRVLFQFRVHNCVECMAKVYLIILIMSEGSLELESWCRYEYFGTYVSC